MQWNIAAECVSLVFISILLVYSREYNLIPSLKNKMFRLFLNFVFFELLISIISIISIQNYRVVPGILNQAIQMVYFLVSPLMAVLFVFYIISVVWEDDPKIPAYLSITAIPYALYVMLVLTNPLTGLLYGIGEPDGFTYGKGFFLTYLFPALYMLAIFFIILIKRRKTERILQLILLSFPIISLIMLGIQLLFPGIILSGSAATSALLIVYLYLQNKQIVIDDLTGFQNRKAFLKVLEINVKRKWEMDIILISLDGFKMVNDKFGQLNGDNFLKTVSQYLKKVVPIKSVYRFSGDEFIIILDKDIHIQAVDVVKAIRKRFDDHWDCGILQCMLSVSIAVVRFPDNADTVETIITLLEYCIVLSKKNGNGKTIYPDAETVGKMIRKKQIIDLMKRGLTQDIFEVHYQPIYSMKEKRFTTAEALLRLSDSELGAISPAEFIPFAEEAGLIVDIGFLVLDKVCRFIRELDDKGVEIETISVNISTIQLDSEGFVNNLLEIINRNRVSPYKLSLEITERIFVENFKYMSAMIRKINEYGIQFYLDDFGTGYSNIINVVKLPLKFIKIDKSILYESVANKKSFSLLDGLSRTFSEIGMKVVVEGVETLEHSMLAEQINADYIQGFLFARPMPAAEAIHYLGRSLSL
jgi:diguanylate cyclase (GGDEF)-like protein